MSDEFDAVHPAGVFRRRAKFEKILRRKYVDACRSVLRSYCLFNTDGPTPSYAAPSSIVELKTAVLGRSFSRKIGRNTKFGSPMQESHDES
jgi:hypothetical protein